MQNIGLIFIAFAFVFAAIAAFWGPGVGRVNFLALAVMCWIASELIGGFGRVFH